MSSGISVIFTPYSRAKKTMSFSNKLTHCIVFEVKVFYRGFERKKQSLVARHGIICSVMVKTMSNQSGYLRIGLKNFIFSVILIG